MPGGCSTSGTDEATRGAELKLTDAIHRVPGEPDAYALRGRIHLARREWGPCADDLAAADDRGKPEDNPAGLDVRTRLRLNLATCQARVGKLADAELALLRAQSSQRLPGEVALRLGEIRIAMGKLDEAIDALSAPAETPPGAQGAMLHWLLAEAYDRARRPGEAQTQVELALRYDRNLVDDRGAALSVARRRRARVPLRHRVRAAAGRALCRAPRVRPALLPPLPRGRTEEPVAPPRRRAHQGAHDARPAPDRQARRRQRDARPAHRDGRGPQADAGAARMRREAADVRIQRRDHEDRPAHARHRSRPADLSPAAGGDLGRELAQRQRRRARQHRRGHPLHPGNRREARAAAGQGARRLLQGVVPRRRALGPPPAPQAEIDRLRRELDETKKPLEFAKKAAAFFAQQNK